jgi:hypothetical protein
MYDVAVLAEQPLSALDAAQVTGLHEGLDEPVRYHVLVPGNEAATRTAAELIEIEGRSGHCNAVPERADSSDPVDALVEVVERTGAAEVIVLTASHPVRETLHRDWASQVRRRVDLPTLHLLEHESFEEQSAGRGEGNQLL